MLRLGVSKALALGDILVFPDREFPTIGSYFDAYASEVTKALASIDHAVLERVMRVLTQTIKRDGHIYVCGNGGSAAISNHLQCDYAKGISTGTDLRPRVQSLSTNIEIITAIANDIEYAEIFVYQLSRTARDGDTLIAISASGNSENICRALRWARENGLTTIALTGFDGGTATKLANVTIHIAAENYGVVEDVHQSVMHILAQYIRKLALDERHLGRVRF